MDAVNVRNLDQIQEQDGRSRASRLGVWLLAAVGGTAVVVAGVMSRERGGPAQKSDNDPLAALVASARARGPATPEKLEGRDVSFPAMLSDTDSPTTALAAVKDEHGRLLEAPALDPSAVPMALGLPHAGDRLPVVPLPAGTLLGATSVTTAPRDELTAMAAESGKVPDSATLAPAGADGGYQLQVASFKEAKDADALVLELRKRGHRAYRQAAYVQERGLWHRVRVGPFKSKFEADQYRSTFEKSERMSPFVVDPFKVKQAEETRAAKGAARVKKYGRE